MGPWRLQSGQELINPVLITQTSVITNTLCGSFPLFIVYIHTVYTNNGWRTRGIFPEQATSFQFRHKKDIHELSPSPGVKGDEPEFKII